VDVLVPAHGIGSVQGLPLDPELVLQTGGAVVLVSFLAVALLWRSPRLQGPVPGIALPAAVVTAVDSPRLRTVVQIPVLLLAVAVTGYGLLGPQDPAANPAPRVVYVLLWVGLAVVSLVLGPVWRVLNPLRMLHRVVAAVLRVPVHGRDPTSTLPARLGQLPAALGLAAFVWLELVAPGRDRPAVVAGFLLGYAVLHTAAAVHVGARWFDRADTVEVYSALAGSLAPVGRLGDGRLGLRNPLRGPATVTPAPGLVAFLAVWWGSTAFDGLSGRLGWEGVRQAAPIPAVLLDTLVLAVLVLAVALVYRVATGPLARPLAATLVPIAAGYTIAHYATLLAVEGPRAVAQLRSPGELLGPVTSTAVPSPGIVAAVQVGAILVGHVVAVVAAHDRCLAVLPRHRRLADQVPLVLLMVAYTMAGLLLLVIS
jgi:hypothetical protein